MYTGLCPMCKDLLINELRKPPFSKYINIPKWPLSASIIKSYRNWNIVIN